MISWETWKSSFRKLELHHSVHSFHFCLVEFARLQLWSGLPGNRHPYPAVRCSVWAPACSLNQGTMCILAFPVTTGSPRTKTSLINSSALESAWLPYKFNKYWPSSYKEISYFLSLPSLFVRPTCYFTRWLCHSLTWPLLSHA